MKKLAAIPMSEVLEALAQVARRPKVVAKRVAPGASKTVKRVVAALPVPGGYRLPPKPITLGPGAMPAKAKIQQFAKLIMEMEKGGAVGSAYFQGFLEKLSQEAQPTQDAVAKYLAAVKGDAAKGKTHFKGMIDAGGIGIGDVGAKSIADLNQKKLSKMFAYGKTNPRAAAHIQAYLKSQTTNPYGRFKNPVLRAAFSKAQGRFRPAIKMFLDKHPNLLQDLQAQSKAPAALKTPVKK